MTINDMALRSGLKRHVVQARIKAIYPEAKRLIKDYDYSLEDYEAIKIKENFKHDYEKKRLIFIGKK